MGVDVYSDHYAAMPSEPDEDVQKYQAIRRLAEQILCNMENSVDNSFTDSANWALMLQWYSSAEWNRNLVIRN